MKTIFRLYRTLQTFTSILGCRTVCDPSIFWEIQNKSENPYHERNCVNEYFWKKWHISMAKFSINIIESAFESLLNVVSNVLFFCVIKAIFRFHIRQPTFKCILWYRKMYGFFKFILDFSKKWRGHKLSGTPKCLWMFEVSYENEKLISWNKKECVLNFK